MTNLSGILVNSNYDFYFLVVDRFLDIDLPQLTNFYSISPWKFKLQLAQKNSGRLLSHPNVIDYIQTNSSRTKRKPVIIPFKPSAKIELLCRRHHWLLAANPSRTNRLFEDKLKFYQLCHKQNLPLIPTFVAPLSSDTFRQALDKFSCTTLVIQTRFGWAGNSSHLASSFKETSHIPRGTPVKFSPYLKGYTLINNCCLSSSQLFQSPPGLQYTGIPQLTSNPLSTVGRQWPSFAPDSIVHQITDLTSSFSAILKKHLYLGYFGLDYFVADNKIYFLECNPRLTASFAFYTELENKIGLDPLFYIHLAVFTDLLPDNIRYSPEISKIIGSQITKKNSSGATISKYQQHSAFVSDPDNILIDQNHLSRLS